MAENFYTILTSVGRAKLANAQVTGQPVEFKQMALGDGGGSYYNPDEKQTNLKNEVWRGNVNQISIDSENPSWIVVETVVLANTGGFTVREAGIFDKDGDMIAIGKFPETFKPIMDDGSAKDLYIRMILEVTNASSVTLKIDPSAIFATKDYVDQKVAGVKIPDASLTQKGIVQLSNATNSTRENVAATEKAVKSVKDNIPLLNDTVNSTSKIEAATANAVKTAYDQGKAAQDNLSTHLVDYVKHAGFAVSAGTSTAYTVALNPPPTSLVAGMTFRFKAHVDSGANPTINPNGLGAKAAKKANGNAASFKKDGIYTVTYDGTSAFILQGEGGGDIQVVKGTIGTDTSGTIANLPFKPAMLLIKTSVYLSEMIGWEKNGDGIYASAESNGHIIAFKASENDAVVSGSLTLKIYKELSFTKEVSLKSVAFGVNFINYTFSDSYYGQHDYYVLGT